MILPILKLVPVPLDTLIMATTEYVTFVHFFVRVARLEVQTV